MEIRKRGIVGGGDRWSRWRQGVVAAVSASG
ncbi:hypothetical protein ES319_A05G378000v1 [Gossypium barbadense]|uniref:Uncharacterized protein n=1 Tax=Gossypium barbadense TaxID=3634 RepID=A0A5J5VZM4_GOSBA|nr:hypothetical protein ES319_A05G378000v1 [Gossypium barbadense]